MAFCPGPAGFEALLRGWVLRLRISRSVSMGEPLTYHSVTPICRRWDRAWLDKPLRFSKYSPQNSQRISRTGSDPEAAERGRRRERGEGEGEREKTDQHGSMDGQDKWTQPTAAKPIPARNQKQAQTHWGTAGKCNGRGLWGARGLPSGANGKAVARSAGITQTLVSLPRSRPEEAASLTHAAASKPSRCGEEEGLWMKTLWGQWHRDKHCVPKPSASLLIPVLDAWPSSRGISCLQEVPIPSTLMKRRRRTKLEEFLPQNQAAP